MTLPLPIITGPASAKILAPACTTVPGPIVISPLSALSSDTTAPAAILRLTISQNKIAVIF